MLDAANLRGRARSWLRPTTAGPRGRVAVFSLAALLCNPLGAERDARSRAGARWRSGWRGTAWVAWAPRTTPAAPRARWMAGRLVPDAHLAALAVEAGRRLSTDGDFAKFPGLSWKNPLAATR